MYPWSLQSPQCSAFIRLSMIIWRSSSAKYLGEALGGTHPFHQALLKMRSLWLRSAALQSSSTATRHRRPAFYTSHGLLPSFCVFLGPQRSRQVTNTKENHPVTGGLLLSFSNMQLFFLLSGSLLSCSTGIFAFVRPCSFAQVYTWSQVLWPSRYRECTEHQRHHLNVSPFAATILT